MNATDFFEEWYGKTISPETPITKYNLKNAFIDGYAKGRQNSSKKDWLGNSYIAELHDEGLTENTGSTNKRGD